MLTKSLKGEENMYFLWIDCEMSGLDYVTDEILEIACILTDENINTIFEYESVFYHSEIVLNNMNQWCLEHHKKSGLVEKVLHAKNTYAESEKYIIDKFHQKFKPGEVYLAGNSVYMDRMFLAKYMPRLISWTHYRLLDISTLKIIAESKGIKKFEKKKMHTACQDIRESIEEYKHYQTILFKS